MKKYQVGVLHEIIAIFTVVMNKALILTHANKTCIILQKFVTIIYLLTGADSKPPLTSIWNMNMLMYIRNI